MRLEKLFPVTFTNFNLSHHFCLDLDRINNYWQYLFVSYWYYYQSGCWYPVFSIWNIFFPERKVHPEIVKKAGS